MVGREGSHASQAAAMSPLAKFAKARLKEQELSKWLPISDALSEAAEIAIRAPSASP